MAEQRFGRVIARGTDAEIAMVKRALEEAREGLPLPRPLEECLTRDFVIEFHSSADFIAKKRFVPGTNNAAYGYALYQLLWVNSDKAEDEPALGRHIIRHEIAHALFMIYLNAGKRESLRKIIRRADGSAPASWSPGASGKYSAYQMRCNEIIADKLAVAISGKSSPWDQYQFFGLDIPSNRLWLLIAITFRMPEVPPVPDPHLAQISTLTAQVGALTAKLGTVSELEAQIEALTVKLGLAIEQRDLAIASRARILAAWAPISGQLTNFGLRIVEETPAS